MTRGAPVPPGIHRITLPTRSTWLPEVNAYLITGPDGLLLVDTGVGIPEGMTALTARLAALGHKPDDIALIIVTHAHPDHIGLAATLSELSGAEVRMHPAEMPFIDTTTVEVRRDRVTEWYRRNGMPVETPLEWRGLPMGAPSQPTPLNGGEIISWGDAHLEVVWTPGHSPGLLCLLDAERRILISSDHVLEDITPHVGLYFDQARDPLYEYLESLDRVGRLAVDLVLPGHGDPFNGLGRRVQEIAGHHHRRCAEIRAALTPAGSTAAEIARELSWVGRIDGWAHLDQANRGSALSETLAHLRLMERNGAVESTEQGGVVTWVPA
ncbi:MAG TPA: MBL fold metallo-hydrolase [Candidatus Dormibacteraeota bacterium]